jgi:hypothetical protein
VFKRDDSADPSAASTSMMRTLGEAKGSKRCELGLGSGPKYRKKRAEELLRKGLEEVRQWPC